MDDENILCTGWMMRIYYVQGGWGEYIVNRVDIMYNVDEIYYIQSGWIYYVQCGWGEYIVDKYIVYNVDEYIMYRVDEYIMYNVDEYIMYRVDEENEVEPGRRGSETDSEGTDTGSPDIVCRLGLAKDKETR